MGPRILGTLADKLPNARDPGVVFGGMGGGSVSKSAGPPSLAREARATDSARESACFDQHVEVAAIEEQSAHAGQRDSRQ